MLPINIPLRNDVALAETISQAEALRANLGKPGGRLRGPVGTERLRARRL